jgi:hypothetical protein
MGMDEVEYSSVTKTESRMGCGLGGAVHRHRGIFQHTPREASGIKRNSAEHEYE